MKSTVDVFLKFCQQWPNHCPCYSAPPRPASQVAGVQRADDDVLQTRWWVRHQGRGQLLRTDPLDTQPVQGPDDRDLGRPADRQARRLTLNPPRHYQPGRGRAVTYWCTDIFEPRDYSSDGQQSASERRGRPARSGVLRPPSSPTGGPRTVW